MEDRKVSKILGEVSASERNRDKTQPNLRIRAVDAEGVPLMRLLEDDNIQYRVPRSKAFEGSAA
jgi:hypothetical protein